jgi:arylsulfatase
LSPHHKHRHADTGPGRLSRRDFLKLSGLTAGSAALTALGRYALARPLASAITSTAAAPNIILIVVDALRSDHVSADGYSRTTTPNLDAWIASQGVSFRRATSTAPWTYPANAAMLTGRGPASLGVPWFDSNANLPAHVTTLAEHLHAAGYYTAGFVSAEYVRGFRGFARGFDLYDDAVAQNNPVTSASGLAGEINNRAVSWLQTAWTSGQQPLFLFLYYFDPHTWYNPPQPYDVLYDPTYAGTLALPNWYRDGQDVVSGLYVPTPADVQHLLALYDGEIKYCDDRLGEMLAALQARQLLDNTLVVLTADHGDMFGEHGKWNHTNCLYEEVLRVPLFMRYSGVISPGRVVDTPVQNMDLMPTILDWTGIPIPPTMQAISLRPLAEGRTGSARDLFSEMDGIPDPSHPFYWIAPHHDLRSIQRGAWKYIHHVQAPDADELYQLNANSPYETDNVILSDPAVAQELRQAILDWFPRRVYLPVVTR